MRGWFVTVMHRVTCSLVLLLNWVAICSFVCVYQVGTVHRRFVNVIW